MLNNKNDIKLAILNDTTTFKIFKIGLLMAKTNYSYEKHGREMEKKKKKEEKLKKKQAKNNDEKQEEEISTPSDESTPSQA
ncbi:MAG: flagellar biosynthesis component FlhA [Sulfurimonas sp.]